ncbi:hypothetical protein [Streptomyces sp. BRA346]|uniref:hypothetical protein n=1 Tax=Streptomyces sp. BRA346 TaxID=2878199 RepID=UPI0040641130
MADHRRDPSAPPVEDAAPERLVADISQKVSRAWHGSRDRGNLEIPVGVVASLAMLRQPERGAAVAEHLAGFTPSELVAHHRRVWALLWIIRPELAHWARPLHGFVRL